MYNNEQSNKVTPQQVGGTITIANGNTIQIGPGSVSNNNSNQASMIFVQKLKKAIEQDLFKKED
jgi:hypothetical protein